MAITSGALGPIAYRSPGSLYCIYAPARPRSSVLCCPVQQRKTFRLTFSIIMHRVARGFSTAAAARCPKTTSAARLAAHSLRSAVVRPPAAARAAAVGAGHSRRTIHVRVPLPYEIEDGLGDFLSPDALRVVAVEYQQGLLDRLNEQIKGAPPFALYLVLFFFFIMNSHVR